jgi:gallate decarboxylase subunit C
MQKVLRKEKPAAAQTNHAADLRTAVNWLRGQGDLIETDKTVDPDLEITGLQKTWTAAVRCCSTTSRASPITAS